MKKKILLSITALFVLFIGLVKINAGPIDCPAGVPSTTTCYSPLFKVGTNVKAVAPLTIPNNDTTVYATVTDGFDFSKIVFKTLGSGNNTVTGSSALKKIIIGQLKGTISDNSSSTQSLYTLFGEGDDPENEDKRTWFNAYCLDYDKKYPLLGVFSSGGTYSTATNGGSGYAQGVVYEGSNMWNWNPNTDEFALSASIALAAISNDSNFTQLVTKLKTHFGSLADVEVKFIVDGSNNATYTGIKLYSSTGDISDFYRSFMGEQDAPTNVSAGIVYIGFTTSDPDNDAKDIFFVASMDEVNEIADTFYESDTTKFDVELIPGGNLTHGSDYYAPLSNATLQNLAFTKYKASTDTSSINHYEHVLWIVENSYPTLSIDEALANAGVDREALRSQIKALYSINDSKLDEYEENVIYGIVQHAIWQVIGKDFKDGFKLGTSLNISESGGTCTGNLCQLNKLYTYLIDTSRSYTGYSSSSVYSDKITFTEPDESKKLVEMTDNAYIYGPYKASYVALTDPGQKMTISITTENSNNIKIVDSNKQVITELDKDQLFYISVDKSSRIGTVNISAELGNVTTFWPASDRGRVYNPVTGLVQNALSGGRKNVINIVGDLSVDVNPKTGVENIALLLMVTLVAFTLGYLVLSYKQKPTVLNQ